jgi:hypothetical protein
MVTVNGQQKVDLDRALTDNPELYSGSFSRIGIGFSRSNFNYGSRLDGLVLNPLHMSIDLGKRMNRNFGAYFTIAGEVLVKEKLFGVDLLNQWIQGGMRLGGIIYIMGGNSYFAPEVGLDLLTFTYEEYRITNPETPFCAGLGSSLKYGYDIHLSGKLFLGGQLYISYAYCWETGTPASIPAPTANSFVYGAALNLKIGK